MTEDAFDAYLEKVFQELGSGDRLILGVSDNVPPATSLSRMEKIKRKIASFGPVMGS